MTRSDLLFQSHMVQRQTCSHKPFKREWGKTVFPQTQQCIINVDKLGNQILQSWTVPKGRTCSSTNESGALILRHFQRGLKPKQALNVHWSYSHKVKVRRTVCERATQYTRISTELPQTRILSYANSLVAKPLIMCPYFEVTIACITTRAHPERQRVYNVRFWTHPVTAVTQVLSTTQHYTDLIADLLTHSPILSRL